MSSATDMPQNLPPGHLHILPVSPPDWPGSSSNLSISILDSSFNPPTRAHLALASSPPPTIPTTPSQSYSAHLLLFSVSNVDKKPKPTDPTLTDKLNMITLLAKYLPPNTAVGLINEPTFVGKSRIIHEHLSSPSQSTKGKPSLSFIVGTDTLTRFFDPRYYTSAPGGMPVALGRFFDEEGSRLISARRGGEAEREVEDAVLKRDDVKRWAEEGKVALVGTGHEEWVGMSSTKARQAVKDGDWDALSSLVVPEIETYIKQQGLYRE